MKIIKLLAAGCFFLLLNSCNRTEVTQLTVEFLNNPVGVDSKQPRLSWQLNSVEMNVKQTAYEIRVGKDMAALARNGQLAW